jgi:hypothetical protein
MTALAFGSAAAICFPSSAGNSLDSQEFREHNPVDIAWGVACLSPQSPPRKGAPIRLLTSAGKLGSLGSCDLKLSAAEAEEVL